MKTNRYTIEPLEPRIAPASVFTYLDVDLDKVKITSSAGDLNNGAVNLVPNGGNQCAGLDLGAAFKGANITFTVTKAPGGDGLANVGYIDAIGIDLGSVTIKGDLGNIDCGDGDPAQPALKSLKVRSMGRFGLATGGAELRSDIVGRLGALVVTGDVAGVFINVADGADGTIGSVTVGGSIVGGSTSASGRIESSGDIGPVKIGKSVVGGTGGGAGSVQSSTKIASVTVGGSVMGGGGPGSGGIGAMTEVGPVKIGGNLVGGSGYDSGSVALLGPVGRIVSVTVVGSVIGGTETFSGTIHSSLPSGAGGTGSLGNVTIGGSLLGGGKAGSGSILADSSMGFVKIRGDVYGVNAGGYIQAMTTTAGIAIGGSLIGGPGNFTGALFPAEVTGKITIGGSIIGSSGGGYISASNVAALSIGGDLVGGSIGATSIGALTVKGSIVGNETRSATIGIYGKAPADPGFALGSLTVGGRVEWAVISAASVAGANVQIGAVKVGGDWIASSLASGVNPGNAFYGDGDDALFAGNLSRIAAITIGGAIIGSGAAGDSFAFTADGIGSFKAPSWNFANVTGNIPLSTETGSDVRLREI